MVALCHHIISYDRALISYAAAPARGFWDLDSLHWNHVVRSYGGTTEELFREGKCTTSIHAGRHESGLIITNGLRSTFHLFILFHFF